MQKDYKLTAEDLWYVAKSFIEEEGLVQHQIRSYNYFIRKGLQELVNSLDVQEIKTKHGTLTFKFGTIEVDKPRVIEIDGTVNENITPAECRLRKLTYAAPLYAKMNLYLDGRLLSSERVEVGIIPVMVKSDICPLSKMTHDELLAIGEDPMDPGGYFIINGSERVIVAIEDLAPNKILVTEKDVGGKPQYTAVVLSSAFGRQAKVEVTYKEGGPIRVFFSRIYKGIPAIILLRALGMTNDREIVSFISPVKEVQELLEAPFKEAEGVETVEDALKYIGNKIAFGYAEEYRVQRAEQLIDNVLLPHIGTDKASRYLKAVFLCEMIGRVLETSLGLRKPSDKDHYANKRVKLATPLLMELYRMAFLKLIRDVRYQLERLLTIRQPTSISTFVRPGIVADFVKHAFATGNWPGGRVGVTQLLNRTNYLATLSHLRRVQSPLSRSQPHFEARDLHGTHWGRICPAETPEGSNCGLVKNLALSAEFSFPMNRREVLDKLYVLGVMPLSEAISRKRFLSTKVFVDGLLVGFHPNGQELVTELRNLRRNGEINNNMNVALYSYKHIQEVWINTDEGRVRRPLIIVERGLPRLNRNHVEAIKNRISRFRDLVSMGIIEFLDAEEEENAYVALTPETVTPEHTHVEISPYMMLGAVTSIIPYAEHNQSPRNVYEGAMAKQALGFFASNYEIRTDSRMHLLVYPQKPIVTTKSIELIGLNSRPIGQNMVVAILSAQGYNMEDAVVLNKSSVERGLGLSLSYRTYEVESRQYLGGQRDRFGIPEPSIRGYKGEQYYRILDADGLAHIESDVSGNMVIVGVMSPPRFIEEYTRTPAREMVWRDASEVVRQSESGVVDQIFITRTDEGNKLVKARVRTTCFVEIGDKFSSRHGQKGVVGALFPQEDMPYTEDGIVPDLIINPHAFPSRMTIGQLIESIAGKVAAIKAEPVDGTPFFGKSLEELRAELEALGFKSSGTSVMYDGLTGKKFEAEIFIGVVYYQRLHHLVRDKIHARARGQVQMLTRQPTEGRARGGGLKFGEMERDCLVAHGAAYLLLDRLLEQSDKYVAYFCEKCGLPAYYDLKQERMVCRVCGKEASIKPVVMSYAFYLLLNELLSMCIYPKVKLEELV
ncbi:MAG: DNA-directed RNA polymerase subunit B [Candidatus Terraquivivens tikiterensis]|uniref:DNA-directed RNA polymerase subunit beta n=1 Tax=Candidatus Terraquivivens tikiterensis TaxID=1980982 RepID=A0A2R7Y287_9ARCH|nr:MAG: DNA-directed RNA polymerase subunit B [Candidatus Terraquivivens tikiterensis]